MEGIASFLVPRPERLLIMRYSSILTLTRRIRAQDPGRKMSTPLANFEGLTQPPKTC